MFAPRAWRERSLSPPEVNEVWIRYDVNRDLKLRDQLILQYAPLVKYVVDRLAVPIPACLEYEDLISHGIVGLLEAVERFDPQRGVQFKTYAVSRIRGQIIDALRALDLLPRSARRRAREIEAAIRALHAELGRPPTDEEVARRLGTDLESFRQDLAQASCILVSLDSPLESYGLDEGMPLGELLTDEYTPTPMEQAEEDDLRLRLRAAIQELPERERLVIALYHTEELTMKEIGQVLNISESRVSQIYAKTILTLRAMLERSHPPEKGGTRVQRA